jgi:pimeloyl-ACP methyl ester carboxylesterase
VVYEFGQLSMPTLLLIGQKDTTAIGKDAASPEVRAKIGHYPELGKAAAKAIPDATLVEFADLGHAPQMQDPDAFHKALLEGLAAVQGSR